MADKTMPERIYACRDTVVDAWGGTVEEGWHTVPQFDEEAEYIRADLAAGDASEPLSSGQYRWIKQGSDYEWEPAFVSAFGPCDDPDFEFMTIGEDDSISVEREDVAKIGPVIRPPADTAN